MGIDPAKHWDTVLGTARRADHGPWQSVSVYDHFHTIPIPTDEATHEAWTLMAALAASTRRIRLGQMCDPQRQATLLERQRTANPAVDVVVLTGERSPDRRSRAGA